jgi:hypothetical protein
MLEPPSPQIFGAVQPRSNFTDLHADLRGCPRTLLVWRRDPCLGAGRTAGMKHCQELCPSYGSRLWVVNSASHVKDHGVIRGSYESLRVGRRSTPDTLEKPCQAILVPQSAVALPSRYSGLFACGEHGSLPSLSIRIM